MDYYAKQRQEQAGIRRVAAQASIPELIQVINTYMAALTKRGFPIREWEDKARVVKYVQAIGGRVYLLAEDPNDSEDGSNANIHPTLDK